MSCTFDYCLTCVCIIYVVMFEMCIFILLLSIDKEIKTMKTYIVVHCYVTSSIMNKE